MKNVVLLAVLWGGIGALAGLSRVPGVDSLEPTASPVPAAVCPYGRESMDGSVDGCCWEGQVLEAGVCVGTPTACSAGMESTVTGCREVFASCDSGWFLMADQMACCRPGQRFDEDLGCVGTPDCPRGTVARGDRCVVSSGRAAPPRARNPRGFAPEPTPSPIQSKPPKSVPRPVKAWAPDPTASAGKSWTTERRAPVEAESAADRFSADRRRRFPLARGGDCDAIANRWTGVRSAPDALEIDTETVDAFFSHIGCVARTARGVPSLERGRLVGLRLFSLKRGSLYRAMGLQDDDVLLFAGDEPRQVDHDLFVALRDRGRGSLRVLRDGRTIPLKYVRR